MGCHTTPEFGALSNPAFGFLKRGTMPTMTDDRDRAKKMLACPTVQSFVRNLESLIKSEIRKPNTTQENKALIKRMKDMKMPDPCSISTIERARSGTSAPDIYTVHRLAAALDVLPYQLLKAHMSVPELEHESALADRATPNKKTTNTPHSAFWRQPKQP